MKDLSQPDPAYFDPDQCDLADLKALCDRSLTAEEVPHAAEIAGNIPIYDAAGLPGADRRTVMAEWARNLRTGSGVIAIRQAQPDHVAIDAATAVFLDIIAAEKAANGTAADHFAAAGANDRIWNSLQKLCLAAPETFARYHGAPALHMACEAWLGPNYQMTAQVNLVHPGGAAQQAHRDYHLGFQTAEVSARYPAHVHDLSPVLTLQGALAHCDMEIASGPTKLLPFSQAYRAGYAAWRLPAFRAFFEDRFVQLPLQKVDALFFNPALFHAAGANTTQDVERLANLFQVSSAFGRAMEAVDRLAMCNALYPALRALALPEAAQEAAIAACAEGYSFPTNLDSDPPAGGLAPQTQADLMRAALAEAQDPAVFVAALDALITRQRP